MIDFKGSQFEREIILWRVRWYVAYPISYRQLEEMMGERGVSVDHSTLNRWVIKYGPDFEKAFRHRQGPVGRSGHLDKTYVKIKGKWAYLYRAVDKEGLTIDFLLTPDRDRDAAGALLRKAIRNQGLPEKITIDQSGANTAAIKHYNKTHKTAIIIIRHCKYLNNIVEQDHRVVKRITRPTLGFKSFWAARCTIARIEVMHAIRKGVRPLTAQEITSEKLRLDNSVRATQQAERLGKPLGLKLADKSSASANQKADDRPAL